MCFLWDKKNLCVYRGNEGNMNVHVAHATYLRRITCLCNKLKLFLF